MIQSIHRISIIIFAICFCISLYAQDNQLKLTIIDSITREQIPFASIYSDNESVVADDSGSATISFKINGQEIIISAVAYTSKSIKLTGVNIDTSIVILLAPAQHLLQEYTVVGSKYERTILQEPASIEVIKPQLARANAALVLDEVLDKVPGVQMIDGQANIRGGSGYSYGAGSRVLLTVDDVPAMQADAGLPNWGDIPLENMSQIEILKGAGSVLYGSAAMNGVINFRTAYAGSKPETIISAQATGYMNPDPILRKWWTGSPNKTFFNISHKQKFNKVDAVLGAAWIKNQGFNKGMNENSFRWIANTKFPLGNHLTLQINTLFNLGKRDNFIYWTNDQQGAYIGDTSTLSTNHKTRFFIDPVLTYLDRKNSTHKLIGRLYYVNNNNNKSYATRSATEFLEYRYHTSFDAAKIILTGGLVYTASQVNSELYGDTSFSSTNLAAFAQLERKFFKKLLISTGFRWEYNSQKSPEIIDGNRIPSGKTEENRPVFKAGLNYQLGKYTAVRANWGQGYRYPTIAEKFINTEAGAIRISPNIDLKSEHGWTSEIGIKQGLKVAEWQGYADASLFRSRYKDMIEFLLLNFNKGFQSFNIGDTQVDGVELTLQGIGKLNEIGCNLLLGYTYIDPTYRNFSKIDTAKSTSNSNILKYRMKHAVRVDIGFNYLSWGWGINYVYNSHMVAIDKIFDLVIPGVHDFRAAHSSGFHVFNVLISRTIFKDKLYTGIYVNNLLNRAYTYRPGLLEAPRNIALRVEMKF